MVRPRHHENWRVAVDKLERPKQKEGKPSGMPATAYTFWVWVVELLGLGCSKGIIGYRGLSRHKGLMILSLKPQMVEKDLCPRHAKEDPNMSFRVLEKKGSANSCSSLTSFSSLLYDTGSKQQITNHVNKLIISYYISNYSME